MRFKNILEWLEFALKASLDELGQSLPKNDYGIFEEYSSYMHVEEGILLKIHSKLRGAELEEKSWKLIIGSYFQPLPEIIAWDLIHRNIAVIALAHSNQTNAILLALANVDEAALLRVAHRLYTNKENAPAAFEILLSMYGENYQLLRDLIYQQASEESKRSFLMQYVVKHLQAEDLLGQVNVLKLETEAKHETEAKVLKRLFESNEPRVWRALAENAYTPIDTLEVLITTTGIKYAKDIRHYAKMNLSKRKRNS